MLKGFLEHVIRDAATWCEHSRRKTVLDSDVREALAGCELQLHSQEHASLAPNSNDAPCAAGAESASLDIIVKQAGEWHGEVEITVYPGQRVFDSVAKELGILPDKRLASVTYGGEALDPETTWTDQGIENDAHLTADIQMRAYFQKLPFKALVYEISQDFMTGLRFQPEAVTSLQDTAEAYLVALLHEAFTVTLQAGRSKLLPRDIQVAQCRRARCDWEDCMAPAARSHQPTRPKLVAGQSTMDS